MLDFLSGEVTPLIFVWRGWGPVVLVALFLPLASCAGLMDWHPIAALGVGSLALLGGGLACRYFGRRWNRGSGFHMMWWIPVEVWGWIYIAIGGLLTALIAIGLVKKALIGCAAERGVTPDPRRH